MFCKNCGTQFGDGEKFCPNCGTPAGTVPAPAPVRTAGNLVEKYRSNPLFLAAVICMSVNVFFQLINLFQGASAMGQLTSVMGMVGAGGVFGGLTIILTLIGLCTLAISGLILAGLWMAWASGLGTDKAPMLGKGLNLARIGVFAQMIYLTVVLGLCAILMLVVTIWGSSAVSSMESYYSSGTSYGGALAGVGILAVLLLVGIGVLMFFYYLKARNAVQDAQKVVTAGAAPVAPSMFMIVMTFVLGGLTLLGLFGGGDALGILNGLAGVGSSVLFGIVALQYRKEIAG